MGDDTQEGGGGFAPPPSGALEATEVNAEIEAEVAADQLVFVEARGELLVLIETFLSAVTDETMLAGVTRFTAEHTQEQRIIRDQIFPQFIARMESHPVMGVKIWPRGRESAAVDLLVHKDLREINGKPQQAFNLAGMLAFLLTPSARAFLRVLGFDYRFIEIEPRRLHIVKD